MRSGADSPLTQDRSRDVNKPPGNLTHRSTQATVELAFRPGCLRMSSQVVSIPFSVFYAPPQARIGFRPPSRRNRAVLRSASGAIPYLLRPSARSPPLPSFPLTFSCLSAYSLLGKIAFNLPASFPPRTWIGFLWLLP